MNLHEKKSQKPIKSTPICKRCKKPLRYAGQIECQHCGKMQQSESLIDQLVPPAPLEEHCGHCPEDEAARQERGQKRLAKLYARRPDLLARDKQVHS